MADEDTPYRLDRSMAEAKAALGVPNAKRETERMGRIAQPQVQLDDVSHLSPVSFVPRYTVRLVSTSGVGNRGVVEVLPSQTPYLFEAIVTRAQDTVIYVNTGAAIVSTALVADGCFPTQQNAPATLQFVQGNAAVATAPGFLIEADRIWVANLMIEPGSRLTFATATTNVTCDITCTFQEFPGGTS